MLLDIDFLVDVGRFSLTSRVVHRTESFAANGATFLVERRVSADRRALGDQKGFAQQIVFLEHALVCFLWNGYMTVVMHTTERCLWGKQSFGGIWRFSVAQ